jgi:AcrR family transcriptional regulator
MAKLPDALSKGPTGKERVSQEVMAEHQRDRVLGAAIEVFAERGYPGTTVDHIVTEAKIGVGNFYNLFGGKEECFLQAYDRAIEWGRSEIEAALPADEEWPVQTREALRALLTSIQDEPLRARLALVEVQTVGAKGVERYEKTLRAAAELLARGREVSPNAAELPERLEDAIAGGLAWFLQQAVASGKTGEIKKRLSEAAEIAIEPYIGREATQELIIGS